jgi:hypothetical protein
MDIANSIVMAELFTAHQFDKVVHLAAQGVCVIQLKTQLLMLIVI